MNFITLKELKKMVPVASEFKRVPGLKKDIGRWYRSDSPKTDGEPCGSSRL